MTSSKKSRSLLLVAVAAAVLALVGTPARAGSPSANATLPDRGMPKDGNGNLFWSTSELGYKVFSATAGVSAIQVVDEAGNAVVAGLVRQICVSSGAVTENGWVYDSSTTATGTGILNTTNAALNVGWEIAPVLSRITTGEHCTPFIDAQFNWGLWILQSTLGGAGTTHVYYRPSKGGRN